MKKILTFLSLTILIATLTACSGTANADSISQTTTASDSSEPAGQTQALSSILIAADYDPDDLNVSVGDADTTLIRLEGGSVAVDGSGASVSGTTVTVTNAGVYTLQGILNDGQIVVDTQDADTVTLILDGADITNMTSAPIYVANAEKVVITLAEGTQNFVTDGMTYSYPDENEEPDAAIFSNDDLTINGGGALTVNANYNDGIASDDDLKIISGVITVNAVHDGIKGQDSVSIKDGFIAVNAGADGIQSTNAEETEKGFILIEGGTFNIISGLDAIQAETSLQISGGDFTLTSGGGSANNSTAGGGVWGQRGIEGNPNKPEESAKGLKAGVDITILAGTFDINSADDAIHANNSITIDDGNILLTSGDDGMHADVTLTVNGGDITITQSYEGIESTVLTINDGAIHVTASDDGLNGSGGNDGSSVDGRPGQNMFAESGDSRLNINGGYLYVDAAGDGIDINGPIEMTAGTVIVNGPVENMNGALDYSGSFTLTGGYLLAVGSAGMAQAPSDSSSQYSFLYNFESIQAAGTLVHIQSADGRDILTFSPAKDYQSVVFSSPELANGATYIVHSGGSSSGANANGLYSGGVYTPGTQVASFTTSGMTTYVGAASGGFGPGGRPGGGGSGGVPPTRP